MAKKQNQRFTIGLVAAALLLGAYMVLVESKQKAPTDSTEVTVWSLTDNQAKDLTTLAVTADGQSATYQRTGDSWHLAKEPQRGLEDAGWNTAYANLKDLSATRKVEDKAKDLTTYGLTKPALSLVWGNANTPYKLEVGDKTPTGDAYYMHDAKDDAVYTVAAFKVDGWKALATKPPLKPLPSAPPSVPASAAPAAKPAGATPASALPAAKPAGAAPTAKPAHK